MASLYGGSIRHFYKANPGTHHVHNRQNTHPSTGLGGGMTSGVKFGLAHSSNGL